MVHKDVSKSKLAKRVRFSKKKETIPNSPSPEKSSKKSVARESLGIALQQLTKLKNALLATESTSSWDKDEGRRSFSFSSRGDSPGSRSPSHHRSPLGRFRLSKSASDRVIGRAKERQTKRKALKIVNAAIRYGCAHGLIEKRGKYFRVKSSLKCRSPTPAPIRRKSCAKHWVCNCPVCQKKRKLNDSNM